MSQAKKPTQYEGVRPASKSSIEIDFYYCDIRCKERIKRKPTPANLKEVSNHRGAILNAIRNGTFDYATTFPDSKRRHLFHTPSKAGKVFAQTGIRRPERVLLTTADGRDYGVGGRCRVQLIFVTWPAKARSPVRAASASAGSGAAIRNPHSALRNRRDPLACARGSDPWPPP